MDELIFKIEKIARKSGKYLLDLEDEIIQLEKKEGIGNLVTKHDIYIQEMIKHKLLKLIPNANFIGEESELNNFNNDDGYIFIVDPIDGTTNFVRGFFLSTISIALIKNGEPYIGVCYNPYSNEMFIAQKNKGAYLNRKRINVSDKKLKDGIVLTGNSPYYEELREESFKILHDFSVVAQDFRRFGSSVMEMCNIACGRAEIYFELKLQPWDFAAGMLIVEEAGGKVTDINNKKVSLKSSSSILASNNKEDYLKYII